MKTGLSNFRHYAIGIFLLLIWVSVFLLLKINTHQKLKIKAIAIRDNIAIKAQLTNTFYKDLESQYSCQIIHSNIPASSAFNFFHSIIYIPLYNNSKNSTTKYLAIKECSTISNKISMILFILLAAFYILGIAFFRKMKKNATIHMNMQNTMPTEETALTNHIFGCDTSTISRCDIQTNLLIIDAALTYAIPSTEVFCNFKTIMQSFIDPVVLENINDTPISAIQQKNTH